jgi:hypothetical protein
MQQVMQQVMAFVAAKNMPPHAVSTAQIVIVALMCSGITSSFRCLLPRRAAAHYVYLLRLKPPLHSDMFVLSARLSCNDFTTTVSPAPVPPGAPAGLCAPPPPTVTAASHSPQLSLLLLAQPACIPNNGRAGRSLGLRRHGGLAGQPRRQHANLHRLEATGPPASSPLCA